jgi:hypothetical protein
VLSRLLWNGSTLRNNHEDRGYDERYPAATLRVLALIYGQALALKLKGVSLYACPGESA